MAITKDNTINKKLNDKPSHKGHRKRMYEKYRNNSFDNFSPHEVLEMLLYNCYPQIDTNPIAHNLIDYFGSLENVLNADLKELIIAGLTERAAIIINQYQKVNTYVKFKSLKHVTLNNVDEVGEYCCKHFGTDNIESLYAIFLNNQSKVIGVRKMSSGNERKTESYPLDILREAMIMRATDVIICHNHPSGNLKPSNSDVGITFKIINLLQSAEISFIDHIICTKDSYFSFSQRGLLEN